MNNPALTNLEPDADNILPSLKGVSSPDDKTK
jgi:hypothetical protein